MSKLKYPKQEFLNLIKLDKDFDIIIKNYGFPKNHLSKPNFTTLIRIIIGQQISRNVAEIIWEKLKFNKLDNSINISLSTIEKLHQLGLSKKKSEFIFNLSIAETRNELNLNKINKLSKKDFFDKLLCYKGIGPWTLNNYRLFALHDLDSWPGNDLALMEAVKKLKHFNTRPNYNEMNLIAMKWRPYRGAAALLLWHFHAKTKNK